MFLEGGIFGFVLLKIFFSEVKMKDITEILKKILAKYGGQGRQMYDIYLSGEWIPRMPQIIKMSWMLWIFSFFK